MPDLRYLFWLTLMEHGKENSDSDQSIESVAELEVQEVAQKEVALQPNWAARLEGEWSARTSSGFAETIALDPGESLDALKVTVHLTKGRNTRFELDVRNVGAGIAAPLLRYTGPSQLDAQTLLNHAGAGQRPEPTSQTEAAAWLVNYLFAAGPPYQRPQEIEEDAKQHGITPATLRRARRQHPTRQPQQRP